MGTPPPYCSLWQEAEGSGWAIYIEMPDLKDYSSAIVGAFLLEESNASNVPPAAVIRLYLTNIDHASTSGRTRCANGFMPFEGLRRRSKRYAEVLGHELVHALLALADPHYASVCREMEREVAALASRLRARRENALDDEARARIQRMQKLSEELERHPEEVEVEIWRELLGDRELPLQSTNPRQRARSLQQSSNPE